MSVKVVQANINGQVYNLTFNSTSGKWEGTITAPSATSWNQPSNKYGVTITATDDAGNNTVKDRTDSTLGGTLQLRVLEKDKPTIALNSPSSGARVVTATPIIQFQVRDTGSGIDIASLQLKIDGSTSIGNTAAGMVCNSVPGGYDCTYTPQTALGEGSHTITIQVQDNDDNMSDLLSAAFNIDTVPPALNVSNPSNGLITNNKTLNLTGNTNDTTSSPVIIAVKLNGIDQGVVTIAANGSFSKSLTLVEGTNSIEIKATDSAGLTSIVTRTITLDTKAPTISAVTLAPNPVDAGKTFVITVTVSD